MSDIVTRPGSGHGSTLLEAKEITVVLRRDVHLAAQQRARDERRSLSNFIAGLVEDRVGGADLPGLADHHGAATAEAR